MAFKRHFLVMIWMAFSVLSLSAKKEWNADNVPIPFFQDSTQYVSDPDGYVDRALKDSANFYLQKLKGEEMRTRTLPILLHIGGITAAYAMK